MGVDMLGGGCVCRYGVWSDCGDMQGTEDSGAGDAAGEDGRLHSASLIAAQVD